MAVPALAEKRRHVAIPLAQLAQILPDAEAAADAGEDDGAHVRGGRLLERGRERPVHGGVERVELVRPVEDDRQDRAVARRLDLRHAPPR